MHRRVSWSSPLAVATALLCLVAVSPARADGLGIVKTTDGIPPFDDAITALRGAVETSAAEESLKADAQRWDKVKRSLDKKEPAVWVPVGPLALKTAAKAKLEQPIVFLMVATPADSIPEGVTNVAGVTMRVRVDVQLKEIRAMLPSSAKLGMLLDPSLNDSVSALAAARESAAELGFTLDVAEMSQPSELGGALKSLLDGGIDVLWLIADRTVTPRGSQEAFKFIAELTAKEGVPVVSYAPKHAQAGALFSMGPDYSDIGRQGGEMINRLLAGSTPEQLGIEGARKASLCVNKKVARTLGITLPADALERASRVFD